MPTDSRSQRTAWISPGQASTDLNSTECKACVGVFFGVIARWVHQPGVRLKHIRWLLPPEKSISNRSPTPCCASWTSMCLTSLWSRVIWCVEINFKERERCGISDILYFRHCICGTIVYSFFAEVRHEEQKMLDFIEKRWQTKSWLASWGYLMTTRLSLPCPCQFSGPYFIPAWKFYLLAQAKLYRTISHHLCVVQDFSTAKLDDYCEKSAETKWLSLAKNDWEKGRTTTT